MLWFDIRDFPLNIKRRIWNKSILLGWNRLWLRKDEFHSSLDMDSDAMFVMNKSERGLYVKDLCKRRNMAHERDMEEMEREK